MDVEEVVRGIGWTMLKLVTFGRYKSEGSNAVMVEGALGLGLVAAVMWIVYRYVV